MKDWPVQPRAIYIVTPTASGAVSADGLQEAICTFEAGIQAWFHVPDGVTVVSVSDPDAILTPLD